MPAPRKRDRSKQIAERKLQRHVIKAIRAKLKKSAQEKSERQLEAKGAEKEAKHAKKRLKGATKKRTKFDRNHTEKVRIAESRAWQKGQGSPSVEKKKACSTSSIAQGRESPSMGPMVKSNTGVFP